MKRVIMIILLISLVINCSLIDEEVKEFEATKREMKERGHGCYRDPYSKSGHIVCGYRR